MSTKKVLVFQLVAMALLVAGGALFPRQLTAFIARPELYPHAKLAHVLCATLFFGNVVIGTLWEARCLFSERVELVRYTYETVAWLDAFFTAPLVLLSVVSGLALATALGGLFTMGWLLVAFSLFVVSGVVWVAVDVPMQYRVKRLLAEVPPGSERLSPELGRVLRRRLALNVIAIVPLLVVLLLMAHKPELPSLRPWLAAPRALMSGAVR